MSAKTAAPRHTGSGARNSILISAAIIIALVATGFQARRHEPAHRPCHYYIGIDISGSFRPHLADSMRMIMAMVGSMEPRDHLTLFTVSDQALEKYDGAAPQTVTALVPTLRAILHQPVRHGGTDPARFWYAAFNRIQTDPMQSRVIYVTDGDDDFGAPSHRLTRQEANTIAACTQLESVAVIGVEPGNYEPLRQDLGRLSPRLHVYNAQEFTSDTIAGVMPQG